MTDARPAAVVVLAAGEGTRMRSRTPKVLHAIAGRTMLGHVVATARALDPEHLLVVVGHAREQVTVHLAEVDPDARAVVQEPQNGTGHAVRIALQGLDHLEGTVVVLLGDTPLLTAATLRRAGRPRTRRRARRRPCSRSVLDDPTGYGRVVRDDGGAVLRVTEHKDAEPGRPGRARDRHRRVRLRGGRPAHRARPAVHRQRPGRGVPHRRGRPAPRGRAAARGRAGARAGDRRRQRPRPAGRGGPRCCATGCVARPPARRRRRARPGDDLGGRRRRPRARLHASAPGCSCTAGPSCGAARWSAPTARSPRARWARARAWSARTPRARWSGRGATVGPFSYLRPGTVLGEGAKVGAYVEVKASEIGAGSKVPHLAYVGDAVVGERSNLGAGTIVVNYDGRDKHRTTVGDDVRVGSNNSLVAPVTVHDGAYTAAGSTITEDVPAGCPRRRPGPAAQHRGMGRAQAGAPRHHHRGAAPMSGILSTTEKNLLLFSGRAFPELADEVAGALGVDLVPTSAYDFANGEIFVRFEESVRGSDAFVLQSHSAPINTWVMEQLLMVDALKRASAKRITVVMPFYPYARQDKKHRGPRADQRPAHRRPVQDRRRRPADDRRPAHRADPGLLRRPGRPPVRAAAARRARRARVGRPRPRRRVARRRPGAGRGALDRPARRAAWRSSTSAATPTCPTRSRSARSSARCAARPASSSTT